MEKTATLYAMKRKEKKNTLSFCANKTAPNVADSIFFASDQSMLNANILWTACWRRSLGVFHRSAAKSCSIRCENSGVFKCPKIEVILLVHFIYFLFYTYICSFFCIIPLFLSYKRINRLFRFIGFERNLAAMFVAHQCTKLVIIMINKGLFAGGSKVCRA